MKKSLLISRALAMSIAGLLASPVSAQAQTATVAADRNTQFADVIFTSHENRDSVSKWGETLFGNVLYPERHTRVEITIVEIDRKIVVATGRDRGQFAFRVFPGMFKKAGGSRLTFLARGIEEDGTKSAPTRITVFGEADTSGTVAALNRISFGATPELYNRVRRIGFENYVREQLNPDRSDDPLLYSLGYRKNLSHKEVAANTAIPNAAGIVKVHGFYSQAYVARHNIGHALYSKWQLNEVMTRFWANHFHTIRGDRSTLLYEAVEWNGFRNLAMSSFEELLRFSAHSPTMQSYLDNDHSTRNGMNENYARELLELHTVGVDSSYGDEDIIEVAKILTGWGSTPAPESRQGPIGELYTFKFRPEHHVTEDKVIPFLGKDGFFKGREGHAGVREGRKLLSILAQHPDTKNFICGKLVNLLVADGDKTRNYVKKCRDAWTETDGQIKPMLEAILLNDKYVARSSAGRGKVRSGFEYAVAVGRAFDLHPRKGQTQITGRTIWEIARQGGFRMLGFPTPDGLPENGTDWISSGTMVSKFDAVQTLLTNRNANEDYYNIRIGEAVLKENLETAQEVADYLLTLMTGGRYTAAEYNAVIRVLNDGDDTFHAPDEPKLIKKALGLVAIVPTAQLQ